MTEAEALGRFLAERTEKTREAAIAAHGFLVRITAARFAAAAPPRVEVDDLEQSGWLGLIRAVDQFEPERGVQFRTYAILQIKGAIRDYLREVDVLPKSIREPIRAAERVISDRHRRGAGTQAEAVAGDLGITEEKLLRLLALRGHAEPSSLEEGAAGFEASDPAGDPSSLAEVWGESEALWGAVSHLSEREEEVLRLYYLEGKKMEEIGTILGVGDSWVSKIHSAAIAQLRVLLAEDADFFPVRS